MDTSHLEELKFFKSMAFPSETWERRGTRLRALTIAGLDRDISNRNFYEITLVWPIFN